MLLLLIFTLKLISHYEKPLIRVLAVVILKAQWEVVPIPCVPGPLLAVDFVY